jgi:hypothetical protein
MWDSVHVTVTTKRPSNVNVFSGNSSKNGLRSISTSSVLHLNPFQTRCVGVVHAGVGAGLGNTEYSIDAHVKLWLGYPVFVAVAFLLLFEAPRLSR